MKTITLPADIFESKAIVALSAEFGHAAQIAIVMILCEIAKNGYFIPWNYLQKNFMARNIDLEPDVLDRIVERLVEYEYFDAEMFAKYKVLTSLNLQKRYFRSKKRCQQIGSLPYVLPHILEKYIEAKNEPIGARSEFSGERSRKVCENSDDFDVSDKSSAAPPSKTKVIDYFAINTKIPFP